MQSKIAMLTRWGKSVDIQRLNPAARWSDATIYKGIVHFVEVPDDTSVSIGAQVEQVLQQASRTLEKVGSNRESLLSATIYFTHREDLLAINAAWEAWLPTECAPSRACIKVELVDPLMRIEIAFVAVTA